MRYRWQIERPDPRVVEGLVQGLGLSRLMAVCLANRGFAGIEPARDFLEPQLRRMADPFLVVQMGKAVDRLWAALAAGERLVVFGDYDVDGVSSTALLVQVLGRLGFNVSAYLPSRFGEGYGLSAEAARNCVEANPCSLLLAVDCGSTAGEAIEWLGARGVEVVVIDHHQVSDPPPRPVALVNPCLVNDDENPDVTAEGGFLGLCSVGLAFKLAHALLKRGREEGHAASLNTDLRDWLDLVALGTIADIVPLKGENRILVKAGLERLARRERPGLDRLMDVSGVQREVGVSHVAYYLAPRLNAAGRLESATAALELLMAQSPAKASPLAEALDARNRERQQLEKRMTEEALAELRATFDPEEDFAIVIGREHWHVGVVGIVAARLMKEFHRPTIVLGGAGVEGEWRGSGRSIPGFDLAAGLRCCADIVAKAGGHAMAAGVTVAQDRIDELRERMRQEAKRVLKPEDLTPAMRVDAEAGLSEISADLLEELARMEPHGAANPMVQILVRRAQVSGMVRRMGKEGQHAKFILTDGRVFCEAVWWNCRQSPATERALDWVVTPERNEFGGRVITQLKVLDCQ